MPLFVSGLVTLLLLLCPAAARDLLSFSGVQRDAHSTDAIPELASNSGSIRSSRLRSSVGGRRRGRRGSRNLDMTDEGEERGATIDFVIAGFPKCGTTTLLKAFANHNETDIALTEQCSIASPQQSDYIVHGKMKDLLSSLDQSPNVKRSFKCPTVMYNFKSLVRISKYYPHAKYIIGMRHPVKMLQSFYNYRVTEIHERKLDEQIPTLQEIIADGEPWKGVSPESARFDLFLMQMGKVGLSPEGMRELFHLPYELAIKPTKAGVFVYTMEQMEDTDPERSSSFRQALQEFLGLQGPIQPFGRENTNHKVGSAGFEESINICDDQFAELRFTIVRNAQKAAVWLRDKFIVSPDVTVANSEHFIASLESWGRDPCEIETEAF